MTKQIAAEEPSMDEILASIRKIIAEDGPNDREAGAMPKPAFSAPLKVAAAGQSGNSGMTATKPLGANEGPASLSSRLTDIFGHSSGSPTVIATGTASRSLTAARSAVEDDLGDILADVTASREPARPKVAGGGVTSAESATAQALKDNHVVAASPARAALAAAGPDASTPQPARAEFTRPAPVVIAATPPRTKFEPSAEPAVESGTLTAAARAAARTAAALTATPAPAIEPSKSATEVTSGCESKPIVLAAMPERPVHNSMAPGPAPDPSPSEAPNAPPAGETSPAPVLPAPEPSPQRPPASLPEAAPTPASKAAARPGDDPSAAAVASALGALAAGLAASVRPSNPEIVVSAVEVVAGSSSKGQAQPSGDVGAKTGPSTPWTPSGTAPSSVSVFTTPNAFVEGVALTPVRTLDDTAAELLRPMLRQWLDSNMPRIVERALRIELATGPDVPGKTDPKT